jgi:signal transduction histidine kinase
MNPELILVVEDSPADLMLTRYAFREAHLPNPLQVVEDGEAALAYLSGDGPYADREHYPLPGLILLDLHLPRMSGFEVLAAMRQAPGWEHLPVVALTSSADMDDITRAYELGANGYWVKPLTPGALPGLVVPFITTLPAAPRFLIVDDSVQDRRLALFELRREFPNLQVIESEGADNLTKLVQAGNLDLVITDHALPKVNGLDVLHIIKALDPNLPVIMVTGSGSEMTAAEGMRAGLDDYVLKSPKHLVRLPSAVRLALARARIRLAAEAQRVQAEQQLTQHAEELEEMVQERTRELRAAQQQLLQQERLTVLGQLAGSVAHELRNPIGVISNAVYFLKAVQPNAAAAVLEYLSLISAEVNNANKIISDLLDFARNRSAASRAAADLAALVAGVLQKYPPAANITVAAEYARPLPPLYVDPRQIEQVLTNLIVNACQAMPQGGTLTLRAEVVGEPAAAGPEPGFVALAVTDTGTGITPENMRRLFEPLFTTKAKGIGLGLAVSKKLVEANGGKIEVRSAPGQGTTFTVVLPVADRIKD